MQWRNAFPQKKINCCTIYVICEVFSNIAFMHGQYNFDLCFCHVLWLLENMFIQTTEVFVSKVTTIDFKSNTKHLMNFVLHDCTLRIKLVILTVQWKLYMTAQTL